MEPLIPQKDLHALKEMAAILMNSYYSNLIEGQSTHPYCIDQALKKHYESDSQKRNLQKLAISRGLARKKTEYYRFLALADDERKEDYDGRGALSDQSLSEFCKFFLSTAIDQVEFMTTILSFKNFEKRLIRFSEMLTDFFNIREESFFLLRDLYLRG